MQGCTFIFKRLKFFLFFSSVLLAGLSLLAVASAFANDPPVAGNRAEEKSDEILSGPYSEYGEFDSGEDEDDNERFFQYGRFFGIGLGTGLTTATGNAGRLYQGNTPMVAFRLACWLDFHWAIQMDVQNSKHNYDVLPDGLTDVNLFRTLLQIKYYFDTRDLSAPITFIGPHIIAGGGFYQRSDNIGAGNANAATGSTVDTENAFGLNAGAGLELTLKPKKVYLQIEGLAHMIQFRDQFSTKFKSAGIPDRTGTWIVGTVALMWTW